MVDVRNKESIKKYFPNDEIGLEMFECVQSIPIRFREDALEVFCNRKDRNMWDLRTVDKAWTYYLEDIIKDMSINEQVFYNIGLQNEIEIRKNEIAKEIGRYWLENCPDDMYYDNCIESILNEFNQFIESGPIPNIIYEIWDIIEKEYC